MKITMAYVHKDYKIKNGRGAMTTPKNEVFIGS